MRTLKTLAAFGALLLIASSANASITFTLHAATPDDGDGDINVEFDMFLSEGQTVSVLDLSWQYTNAIAVGPGPNGIACGTGNQSACAIAGMTFTGAQGGNDQGSHWLWDGAPNAVGGVGGTTFQEMALFTVNPTGAGEVRVGLFEIFDASFNPVTDITVIPYTFVPIPEPSTVALLGLGFVALGFASRRNA